MKKNIVFSCFLFTVLFAGSAFAGSTPTANNYSGMSTVQLSHMRYEIRATASPQEVKRFEAEWQKRLRAMPLEVKQRHFPNELKKAKDVRGQSK